MHEVHLKLLQALRFKGRAAQDMLASATGLSMDEAARHLAELTANGYCQEASNRYRLTPAGREQLDRLLQSERQGLDAALLSVRYESFVPFNDEYKRLIHAWQVREGIPNDHKDANYDANVISRIDALHQRFAPLLDTIVGNAPRLAPYPGRFANALTKVKAGDTSWLAKPLVDSHHTVWFELHEDLIGLAGHTRMAEAQAGRAD